MAIGAVEGLIGYCLFAGIPTGSARPCAEGWVQEIRRMPIAGIEIPVVATIVTISRVNVHLTAFEENLLNLPGDHPT